MNTLSPVTSDDIASVTMPLCNCKQFLNSVCEELLRNSKITISHLVYMSFTLGVFPIEVENACVVLVCKKGECREFY